MYAHKTLQQRFLNSTLGIAIMLAGCSAVLGFVNGYHLGAIAEMRQTAKLMQVADSAARSDYADLVNECYSDVNEYDVGSAFDLYGCIASK